MKEDLDKYKKENEQLKLNLDKYRIENDKLKADLFKANEIISSLKNNQNNSNNELKILRDDYNKLKYELTLKDNELKNMSDKLNNKAKEDMKVNFKDIKFVTFVSMDSKVQCGIKSLPKDFAAEVDDKPYEKYNNLKNTNNMYTANSKPILSFKKISENNIKDGDIFQLYKLK